jgi:hypothetical protein
VLGETVTLTRVVGSFDAANSVASRILGEDPFPKVFELIHVEPGVQASLETFRRDNDHERFTDASSFRLCESRGIDSVSSFDDGFDGLVPYRTGTLNRLSWPSLVKRTERITSRDRTEIRGREPVISGDTSDAASVSELLDIS